ncbi:hypothetical protein [Phytohabitans rumicis]|uniref:Uncharacterized protein n=1 Tax=Phytohabitans rumicis TaxID=1076125 RepID=A0A6V8LDR2_9ACTN|nr:hypothetical protein [Phytohabitans rumicis]GFJ95373.1 hypothetical protein Prum_090150 [Phytohabitans rumicis]
MPKTSGGFIDGKPDPMMAYAPQGPDPALVGPHQPLNSRLPGAGALLVHADMLAGDLLARFVTSANAEFEGLTRRVTASGVAYLDASSAAAATFIGIVEPTE